MDEAADTGISSASLGRCKGLEVSKLWDVFHGTGQPHRMRVPPSRLFIHTQNGGYR